MTCLIWCNTSKALLHLRHLAERLHPKNPSHYADLSLEQVLKECLGFNGKWKLIFQMFPPCQ